MGFKNWISRLFKKEDKQDNFINYIKSIQNSSIKLLKEIESIEKEKNNLIAAVQAHKEKPDLIQKLKKTIEDELEMIEALIKNYRILTSHFYRRKAYRKMNKPGNEELTAAVLKLSDNARKVRDKLKQAKNSMQYGLRYLEKGDINRFLAEHQNEQKRAGDISDIVEDAAPNVALIAEETGSERMKTWGQYLTSGIAHLSRAAVLLIAFAGAMIGGCADYNIYSTKANISATRGEKEKAEEYYNKAYGLLLNQEKQNLINGPALSELSKKFYEIAIDFYLIKDVQKAEEAHKKAQALSLSAERLFKTEDAKNIEKEYRAEQEKRWNNREHIRRFKLKTPF